MNAKLYQRRRRTLALLATCNSITSIVTAVSSEFNCSEEAVQKDINNIDRWEKHFAKIEYNRSVLAGRLSMLCRDAMDSMLSSKEEKLKHQARADALSILKEQINLGDQFGILNRQPQEVNQTLTARLPFEANPKIMEAYRLCFEKQKTEKETVNCNEKVEGR